MQSVVNLIMSCYELLNIDCMPGMVSMWETNYSDLTFFIDQYRQEIQVQYKKMQQETIISQSMQQGF